LFYSSSITYILDWMSESHWFPRNKMLSYFKSFSLKKKFNNFSNRWNYFFISPILCFKGFISNFLKKWSNLKNVKISKKFYFYIRPKGHKKQLDFIILKIVHSLNIKTWIHSLSHIFLTFISCLEFIVLKLDFDLQFDAYLFN
jgi:hypothetical protein